MLAAKELFALKGYNGTSVDQIAAKARVNKATIYYYFDNKQAILDRLINDFMVSMVETLKSYLYEMLTSFLPDGITFAEGKFLFEGDGSTDKMLAFYKIFVPKMLDFFESKRDILQIMVMESLKDGPNRFLLFRFTDLLKFSDGQNGFDELLKSYNLNINVDHELLVMKFFGGILPLIFYSISIESWADHYEMTKETLREELCKLFRVMMMGYIHGNNVGTEK